MRKLQAPSLTFATLYDSCVSGVGNAQLRDEYAKHFSEISARGDRYFQASQIGQLFTLPSTNALSKTDPIVLGALSKSKLTKLYTQYMAVNGKPARHYYDQMFVAAKGDCPFCGGIGHPKTLDHYLPKANFPEYSVLPLNLVPCCRDCNTEKSNAIAKTCGEQGLHPYLDKDHFFCEPWLGANVIQSDPVSLEFHVSPPLHWLEDDRQRVISHFNDYDLAKRFGIEAGRELTTIIHQRKTLFPSMSDDQYQQHLWETADTPEFATNDWRRITYLALALDPWFCQERF